MPNFGGDTLEMNTELKSKFIQYRNHKKQTQGFTLVELLAVIMITGILAAIALPNFLNQDVKAKQAEAKQNVALVNKAQNSYRAENSTFANSFDLLAIGSVSDNVSPGNGTTAYYLYTLSGTSEAATIVVSPTIDAALKGYSGAATQFKNGADQSVIGTVLCEMKQPGVTATVPIATGGNAGSAPTCITADHNKLSL